MKIYIKTIKERIQIDVHSSDKVADVKLKLKDKLSTVPYHDKSYLKLVYKGRVLADEKQLSDLVPPLAESDTLLYLYSLIPPSTDDMDIQAPDTTSTIPLAIPPGPALPDSLQSIVNNLVGAFTNANQASTARQSTVSSQLPPAQMVNVIFPELEEALAVFRDMGFPENRAKKALLLNNCNIQIAMDWLLSHQDDADIDEPLSDAELRQIVESKQAQQSPTVASAAAARPTESLEDGIRRCIAQNRCTFTLTGQNYARQQWYHCFTCGMMDTEGICESCKNVCHKGHVVSEPHSASSFYCDCGPSGKCKCCKPPSD